MNMTKVVVFTGGCPLLGTYQVVKWWDIKMMSVLHPFLAWKWFKEPPQLLLPVIHTPCNKQQVYIGSMNMYVIIAQQRLSNMIQCQMS